MNRSGTPSRALDIDRVLERLDRSLTLLTRCRHYPRGWDAIGVCERSDRTFQKCDVMLVTFNNGAGQRWPVDGFSHRLGRLVMGKFIGFYKWTPGVPPWNMNTGPQVRRFCEEKPVQHSNYTRFRLFDLRRPVKHPSELLFQRRGEKDHTPSDPDVRADVLEALRAAYSVSAVGGSDPAASSELLNWLHMAADEYDGVGSATAARFREAAVCITEARKAVSEVLYKFGDDYEEQLAPLREWYEKHGELDGG